jgi:hypothetical protein
MLKVTGCNWNVAWREHSTFNAQLSTSNRVRSMMTPALNVEFNIEHSTAAASVER